MSLMSLIYLAFWFGYIIYSFYQASIGALTLFELCFFTFILIITILIITFCTTIFFIDWVKTIDSKIKKYSFISMYLIILFSLLSSAILFSMNYFSEYELHLIGTFTLMAFIMPLIICSNICKTYSGEDLEKKIRKRSLK